MSKLLETRKERCRYGSEQTYINKFAKYGWSFSSKQLLNRFGNPMPLGTSISEAEKREKCFYDLTFVRELEKDTVDKLNALQNEDDNLTFRQGCFSGRRVTSCVFLTLIIIVLLSIYFTRTPGAKAMPVVLTLAVFTLIGLSAIVVVGVFRVKKNCERNDEIAKRKQQIQKEVQELLKSDNQ